MPVETRLPLRNGAGEMQYIDLVKVGCGFQGWVYSTSDGSACYRLLPIEQAPVQRRDQIDSWVNRVFQVNGRARSPAELKLAPITGTDHCEIDGSIYYWVRYSVNAKQSLARLLAQPDPLTRVDYVIKVLWQVPIWWAALYEGLMPMPADIVFTEGDSPYLLMLPFWHFPDVETVFDSAERGLYLPPEYVKGHFPAHSGGHLDRYALGVLLLRCLYDIPLPSDGALVLHHVANGSALKYLKFSLVAWMQKLPSTGEAVKAIRRMVDADPRIRTSVEPDALARQLADWRRHVEPAVALQELISEGKVQQAYELAQEILITDDSYPILLLAGSVAHDAGQPVEAIDYLEKAIQKTNEPALACQAQFEILTSPDYREMFETLSGLNNPLGQRIDERVWRDFGLLQPSGENEAQENEVAMADYLLRRQQNGLAASFIWPRLFNKEGQYQRQKFNLRLAYVRTMASLFQPSAAQEEKDKLSNDIYAAFIDGKLSLLGFQDYKEQLLEAQNAIDVSRGRPGGNI
jgi:hypothetical protein